MMKVLVLSRLENLLVDAFIEPIKPEDFGKVIESKKFKKFTEENRENSLEIVKIVMNDEILGLMWFHEVLGQVEIRKIEVIPENVGQAKKFDYLGGCLIAFACQYSINKYEGDVILMAAHPKVHANYLNRYNFKQDDFHYLKSDYTNSKRLVKRFLTSHRFPKLNYMLGKIYNACSFFFNKFISSLTFLSSIFA